MPPVAGDIPEAVPEYNSPEEYEAAQVAEQLSSGGETAFLDDFEVIDSASEIEEMEEAKTAAKWIEEWQKELKTARGKDKENHVDALQKTVAKIIAVRTLTDARRNDASSLKKAFTKSAIDEKVDELMASEHFSDFVEGLTAQDKLADNAELSAKVDAAVTKGHGGGVEDLFRDYLAKLPPGKLQNDPRISRNMPTVKERIESLQDQAKTHYAIMEQRKEEYVKKEGIPKNQRDNPIFFKRMLSDRELEKNRREYGTRGDTGMELVTNAAAEIVALRNLVHAEKDKSGPLGRPIPTGGRSLTDDTKTLSRESAIQNAVRRDPGGVLKAVSKGSGELLTGQLIQKSNQVIQERVSNERYMQGMRTRDPNYKEEMSPEAAKLLGANTRGERMRELRSAAKTLSRKLPYERGEAARKLMRRSKLLLAEYMIHNKACVDRKNRPVRNLEEKLREDVPWSEVNENLEQYKKSKQFQSMDLSAEQLKNALEKVAAVDEAQPLFSQPEPKKDAQQRMTQAQVSSNIAQRESKPTVPERSPTV